jgi:transposase
MAGTITPVITDDRFDTLDPEQMRQVLLELMAEVARKDEIIAQRQREAEVKQATIDKLTYEIAQLKRLRYGAKSEHFDPGQKLLFDEDIDADIAAVEAQLEALKASVPRDSEPKQKPKRTALPAHLPRRDVHHEPEDTNCGCGCAMKRIGEDVSEKLDYTPGVFTVERHVRGKWACAHCRTLVQAPVPAQIIDKGIPTSGLLAHVAVAKHNDHLPLYRQEPIFGRAGLAIPRSTLAAWLGQCGVRLQPLVDALKAELLRCAVLHADETPVGMLAPKTGKVHKAYLWAYASGPMESIKAVVYDFAISRAGEHARAFLGHDDEEHKEKRWLGSLVCDDYVGYSALFRQGVTEVGCVAHARRYFFKLHVTNKSTLAEKALEYFGLLYDVERLIKDKSAQERLEKRRELAVPIANALLKWLKAEREHVTDGTATATAFDYSLNRWAALTRYLNDPALPIDNNHDEQQIRPWSTGRKNWLFAGTLQAGKRAAAITSLIQSAKLNGHDPYAYLKDVLTRLPTQRASEIDALLPHRWKPAS